MESYLRATIHCDLETAKVQVIGSVTPRGRLCYNHAKPITDPLMQIFNHYFAVSTA